MTIQSHALARATARRLARRSVVAAAMLSAAALVAPSAGAQVSKGLFAVTTRVGGQSFEKAASLNTSALVGLDADYALTKNFGLGTSVSISRPNTHKEDFTTTLTYGVASSGGDTTFFYQPGQAVTLADGAIVGYGRAPIGRLTPYVMGGVGMYGAFLDVNTNGRSRRFGGMSTQFGAGVAFQLNPRAGIQLDVRDQMLHSYRPERLAPSRGRNPNVFYPEDFAGAPTRKTTVNNLGYTLGFRYVPAFLNSTTGDPDDRILNPNGGK
jgi:hypothetical protein